VVDRRLTGALKVSPITRIFMKRLNRLAGNGACFKRCELP